MQQCRQDGGDNNNKDGVGSYNKNGGLGDLRGAADFGDSPRRGVLLEPEGGSAAAGDAV